MEVPRRAIRHDTAFQQFSVLGGRCAALICRDSCSLEERVCNLDLSDSCMVCAMYYRIFNKHIY